MTIEGPPDSGAKIGWGQTKTELLSTILPHKALKHRHASLWLSSPQGQSFMLG